MEDVTVEQLRADLDAALQQHAELQAKYSELETKHADVMSEGGSYRNLQVALDAALQKHVDDKAEHEAALSVAMAQHTDSVSALRESHATSVARLADEHRAALESQAKAMAGQHAQEIAELKVKYLVPAVTDLHARRKADLEADAAARKSALEAELAKQLSELNG